MKIGYSGLSNFVSMGATSSSPFIEYEEFQQDKIKALAFLAAGLGTGDWDALP